MTSLLDLLTGILLLSEEEFDEYKREIATIQSTNPDAYQIGVSLMDIRNKCKQ